MNELVKERLKSYRAKTSQQEKAALREIIQEITLLGLWRGKFFEHAAFYGGTALRILYQLDRFSEGLDFTALSKTNGNALDRYLHAVKSELNDRFRVCQSRYGAPHDCGRFQFPRSKGRTSQSKI